MSSTSKIFMLLLIVCIMNVFYIDECPIKAAQQLCDQHVVKMVTETGQMLSNVLWSYDISAPNKMVKKIMNHPCTKWCCKSRQNFLWVVIHGHALAEEYSFRYKKYHKAACTIQICELLSCNISFPENRFTEPPQCVSDQYKQKNTVDAYRAYYIFEKMKFARWKYTERPGWLCAEYLAG